MGTLCTVPDNPLGMHDVFLTTFGAHTVRANMSLRTKGDIGHRASPVREDRHVAVHYYKAVFNNLWL